MAWVGSYEVKITAVSANTSTWERWPCSDLMPSELGFLEFSKEHSSSSPLPRNLSLKRQYPAAKAIVVFGQLVQNRPSGIVPLHLDGYKVTSAVLDHHCEVSTSSDGKTVLQNAQVLSVPCSV